MSPSIKALAHQWLSIDRNPSTRSEILKLLENEKFKVLEERLRRRITFGTAGLRGRMGAGFSLMNDLTIIQASQGLANYMSKAGGKSIVIGHDHRHNSKQFAEYTATAFILKGFSVYYVSNREGGDIPTPFVPFAVDYYKSFGGIMITASHNPSADNGYKVYWKNGCQIIPPHDRRIQDEILVNTHPIEGAWNFKAAFDHAESISCIHYCMEEVFSLYLQRLTTQVITTQISPRTRFVYTPLHGVGLKIVTAACQKMGIDSLISVEEQSQPDPDFGTVEFPNPEEASALDMAKAKADAEGIDLLLANDPDADRFSAAVKDNGNWRQLTGNELGYLFSEYIISQIPRERYSSTYLLNSTVSSQMISSMAATLGVNYIDTLTGFKWIGNKAIELEKSGYNVPFAFEEAIGFMLPPIHDKDGISALVLFLQMYDHWIKSGTSAVLKLEEGFKKYGYFKECNGYYRIPNLSSIKTIFNENIRRLRDADTDLEKPYPDKLGRFTISAWRDLTTGYDSSTKDHLPLLPVDRTTQMITAVMRSDDEDTVRFTVRSSGTEPKLKVYIESCSNTEKKASQVSHEVWKLLDSEWFKTETTGLVSSFVA